jgi:hypothetical protein
MVKRKWGELSKRTRWLLAVAALAEGSLKTAALVDLRRRPSSQVRGSKWAWVPTVTVLNSFGLAPLAYFLFGRKQPTE